MAMRLTCLSLSVLALAACDQTTPDDPQPEPLTCAVTGAPGLTYTTDDGATLATFAEPLSTPLFTFGLAALTGGTLLASGNGVVYRSADEGCTWASTATPGETLLRLTPGGSVAYGWHENAQAVYRVNADGSIQTRPLPPGEGGQPTQGIVGMTADGNRVRVGTREGRLFDSNDGGRTWTALGHPTPETTGSGSAAYHVAFHPSDRDVALVAQPVLPGGPASLWRTTDAGRTWSAAGAVAEDSRTPIFYVSAFAPSDPDVVWAFGKPLDFETFPSNRVYRSSDGGRTFTVEFVQPDDHSVIIRNDPVHLVDPRDPDVLYWSFFDARRSFVDLYRLDAEARVVTAERQVGQRGYSALLASPTRPGLLYIGLESFAFDSGAAHRVE